MTLIAIERDDGCCWAIRLCMCYWIVESALQRTVLSIQMKRIQAFHRLIFDFSFCLLFAVCVCVVVRKIWRYFGVGIIVAIWLKIAEEKRMDGSHDALLKRHFKWLVFTHIAFGMSTHCPHVQHRSCCLQEFPRLFRSFRAFFFSKRILFARLSTPVVVCMFCIPFSYAQVDDVVRMLYVCVYNSLVRIIFH